MGQILTELLGALAFLTRLPVPRRGDPPPLHRLAAWFPAAGLAVGAVAAAAWHLTAAAGLPPAAAAWAAVAAEMLLTGALHPDGLADTADGLGGATAEGRLAIMKDPRLGSFGAIALLLALGGRGVLLAALPPGRVLPALLAAHAASRWAPVWTLARHPYARLGGGTGRAFAGAGAREVLLAAATTLAAAGLLAGARGLAAAGAAALAGAGAAAFAARRLGGVTGDVCGATAEVALLAALTTLALPGGW